MFYFPDSFKRNELQDAVNTFRCIADIALHDAVANESDHTVWVRGTPDQLTLAERLVPALETLRSFTGHEPSSILVYESDGSLPQSTVSQNPQEQSSGAAPPPTPCNLTNCFIKAMYLPGLDRYLQDAVNRLSSRAQIRSVTMLPSSHSIIFRGTAEQLVLAERLIDELANHAASDSK
jgi:hypothetical protein